MQLVRIPKTIRRGRIIPFKRNVWLLKRCTLFHCVNYYALCPQWWGHNIYRTFAVKYLEKIFARYSFLRIVTFRFDDLIEKDNNRFVIGIRTHLLTVGGKEEDRIHK